MKLHYCSHAKTEISETECPQIILALESRQEVYVCRECQLGQILVSACPFKILATPETETGLELETQNPESVNPSSPDITRHNLRQIARLEELLLFSRSYF